jgi:hypothetical protein
MTDAALALLLMVNFWVLSHVNHARDEVALVRLALVGLFASGFIFGYSLGGALGW